MLPRLRLHHCIAVLAVFLLSACGTGGAPFPYVPSLPDEYNLDRLGSDTPTGPVAMLTHQVILEYHDGIASQTVACFDTSGRCIDHYYRDSHTLVRRHFDYDSLGRRTAEHLWQDTAGTSFDSLRALHTFTTYRYSRSGRRCRACLTAPDGRHYTFRLHFDRAGRLTRFIFPDGSRFSYDYDTAGRLARRTWPDASFERFQYDSKGTMTSSTGRDGVLNMYAPLPPPTRVDSLGRVLEQVVSSTSGPDGGTVRVYYQYDQHGNWIRRTTAGPAVPTRLDIRTIQYHAGPQHD